MNKPTVTSRQYQVMVAMAKKTEAGLHASTQYLADQLGISTSSVRRDLAGLEAPGVVVRGGMSLPGGADSGITRLIMDLDQVTISDDPRQAITPRQKLILQALAAAHANGRNPSAAELATATGFGRETIRNNLRRLEERGFIARDRRPQGVNFDEGDPTRILVDIDDVPVVDAPARRKHRRSRVSAEAMIEFLRGGGHLSGLGEHMSMKQHNIINVVYAQMKKAPERSKERNRLAALHIVVSAARTKGLDEKTYRELKKAAYQRLGIPEPAGPAPEPQPEPDRIDKMVRVRGRNGVVRWVRAA